MSQSSSSKLRTKGEDVLSDYERELTVCAVLKGEMLRKLDRNILDVVYYFGENSSVQAEPLLFFGDYYVSFLLLVCLLIDVFQNKRISLLVSVFKLFLGLCFTLELAYYELADPLLISPTNMFLFRLFKNHRTLQIFIYISIVFRQSFLILLSTFVCCCIELMDSLEEKKRKGNIKLIGYW